MMQSDFAGQKLGKYKLIKRVGGGGFGEVYQAEDTMLGRTVAVKLVRLDHLQDQKIRDMFYREARILASLNHENIIPIYEFNEHSVGSFTLPYLVMPYIETTFTRKLTSPLSLDRVTRYLKQICDGLDYAHSKKDNEHKEGVVHLDLKPANILYENGKLRLSDFGLAHVIEQDQAVGGSSLRTGTLAYMAPEHLYGRPQRRSDIYAVGVMLYEMLTSKQPFEAMAVLDPKSKYAPISSFRKDIPDAVEKVVAKALAKEPEKRYATAGELFTDFQKACGVARFEARKTPTPAPPKPVPVKPSMPPKPVVNRVPPKTRRRQFSTEVYGFETSGGWFFACCFLFVLAVVTPFLPGTPFYTILDNFYYSHNIYVSLYNYYMYVDIAIVAFVSLLSYILGYRKLHSPIVMLVLTGISIAIAWGIFLLISRNYVFPMMYHFTGSALWLIGYRPIGIGRQLEFGLASGVIASLSWYSLGVSAPQAGDDIVAMVVGLPMLSVPTALVLWLIIALLGSLFSWGFGFGYDWQWSLASLGVGVIGGMGLADAINVCRKALSAKK